MIHELGLQGMPKFVKLVTSDQEWTSYLAPFRVEFTFYRTLSLRFNKHHFGSRWNLFVLSNTIVSPGGIYYYQKSGHRAIMICQRIL